MAGKAVTGNSYTTGDSITAANLNLQFTGSTLTGIVNADLSGTAGITNANLAGSIADTKLNQITTAAKVSGAAITLLTSVPSGAGVLPAVNTYEDRGDASAFDYIETDLTFDGTWNDLDLSSIVGTNAVFVCIRTVITDDSAGVSLRFRENGNTNAVNIAVVTIPVASVEFNQDLWVQTDASGVIEYNGDGTLDGSVDILVRGWFG